MAIAPESTSSIATPATGLVARVLRARGIWALGDQGVVSLGNFLTSVLLARHWRSEPETFGLYMLCVGVILFLNNLQSSLVIYPLTIEGAAGPADRLPRTAGRAVTLAVVLNPVLAVGLLIVAELTHRLMLLPYLIAAMGMWQLQETLRRALLSRLWHIKALPGDAISYLGQAGIIFLMTRRGSVALENVLLVMAVTSGLAALLQAIQLRMRPAPIRDLPDAARSSWQLGRWPLMTQLINVGLLYLTPWVLTASHGKLAMAGYAALAGVLNLTNPVVVGLCGLIVPAVAARMPDGPRPSVSAGLRYAQVGLVILLPYFVFLLIAPRLALRLFYGAESPYLGLTTELRGFAAGYAMYFLGHSAIAILNGMGRARDTSLATLAGALSNIALCIPATILFGLTGAVWAGLLPIAVQVTLTTAFVFRARGRPNLSRLPQDTDTSFKASPSLAGGTP